MQTVTLSSKFQVVIPEDICRALQLVAGQRMEVRLNNGKVEFTPEKTIASLRGRWPGMDTQVLREADREQPSASDLLRPDLLQKE